MTKLTADDIVDLGRWHFIQFKDEATAEAAMEKYRLFVERQRFLAETAAELDRADSATLEPDFREADFPDESVDDQEERAA